MNIVNWTGMYPTVEEVLKFSFPVDGVHMQKSDTFLLRDNEDHQITGKLCSWSSLLMRCHKCSDSSEENESFRLINVPTLLVDLEVSPLKWYDESFSVPKDYVIGFKIFKESHSFECGFHESQSRLFWTRVNETLATDSSMCNHITRIFNMVTPPHLNGEVGDLLAPYLPRDVVGIVQAYCGQVLFPRSTQVSQAGTVVEEDSPQSRQAAILAATSQSQAPKELQLTQTRGASNEESGLDYYFDPLLGFF